MEDTPKTTQQSNHGALTELEPALLAFCDHLYRERTPQLHTAYEIWNGFEGWLKFELCHWLTHTYGLRAGNDVGVEGKVELTDPNKPKKQIDIWIRAPGNDRWHYVELKVIFANNNRYKQAKSAGSDLNYLSHIKPSEKADQRAILVFGVGFNASGWHRCVEDICTSAGVSARQPSEPPAGMENLLRTFVLSIHPPANEASSVAPGDDQSQKTGQ